MGRQPQTIEEWIKGEKARQDWLDQKLRDAGLRRLTHEGQDTIDALISDLEEALPKGADRAEAIRKLKQNWRVFKCSQKNKTSTLSISVKKRTHESLKKLANGRRETQKATLEKLIEEGFQTEADKKAAIKEAVNQAKLSHFEKHSPLEWPPLSSVFTREAESLRETVAEKDEEIHRLRKELDSLSSTSIEKDESDIAPGSAPDIDDKAEPEPPKLEPTRNVGEILYNRKKPSF
ncbi:MAG: hypothetical protein VX379_05125 [Pseudomonadota bacterium]|jgi:predicted transcriptional regulator|uniref:hypothetical protein n=1 Tax=Alcanivorax TaxID=59753 RepID=UPI000789CED5|nr:MULTISPECIES: hypothetical protein [Alcanivorax]MCK5919363.1 hypothetical protein [Methylococcales bacterium]MED5238939.1 hypothetical protein [Pseudomonadota bacterium]MEE3319466.1 hypothetical protein [Pseudomonadota bacterium]SEG29016.1 hypothetical protein SAMN04515663_11617 [Alcanivorax sp. DSM 26293]